MRAGRAGSGFWRLVGLIGVYMFLPTSSTPKFDHARFPWIFGDGFFACATQISSKQIHRVLRRAQFFGIFVLPRFDPRPISDVDVLTCASTCEENSRFLLLVAIPGAPGSFLLLVAMSST